MRTSASASDTKSASNGTIEASANGSANGSLAGLVSARRVLGILLAFSEERPTLSAKELALAANVPLPSAYRYVALLRDLGLLLESGSGRHRLSGRVFGLADAARAAEPVLEVAEPIMRRLSAATGEGVMLFQLLDEQAVCVRRIESQQLLRVSFPNGQILPLERSATGRVLLASLPGTARRATLAAVCGGDRAKMAGLDEAVARTEADGWTTGDQEIETGIWVAAAAIRIGLRIVACLTVASPTVRARPGDQAALLEEVRAAAEAIGSCLESTSGA